MYELPLFPLNTVLFPGVPLFLHIFEDRYKQMMRLCIEERRPFGVVLIQSGVEAFGPAAPHDVGCTAEIVKVERLTQDRLNIVAVGQKRFRIVRTHTDRPYLRGTVEDLPLHTSQTAEQLQRADARLRPWIERYLGVLRQVSEVRINWDRLPDDPVELAYLAAYILQTPAEQKQGYLRIDDPAQLLGQLQLTYRSEVALLRAMLDRAGRDEPDGMAPFSFN